VRMYHGCAFASNAPGWDCAPGEQELQKQPIVRPSALQPPNVLPKTIEIRILPLWSSDPFKMTFIAEKSGTSTKSTLASTQRGQGARLGLSPLI
jgi:hypothetical protein